MPATGTILQGGGHMTHSNDFPLLGEPLSLDLVNTRVRRNGAELDLLTTPSALAEWLRAESGRLPWSGRPGAADLKALQRLRSALAVLFTARREGLRPPAPALRQLNAALATSIAPAKLAWPAAGPRLARSNALSRRDALLHALASDAAALLTGPSASLLRKCSHPACVLQFVATHPRRRWCSASTCGNRARVARHYRRQQATR